MPYAFIEMTPAEERAYHRRRDSQRASVTALLIAKGLKPGCGKWGEVFQRHMAKPWRA